jgi:DNA processing protein
LGPRLTAALLERFGSAAAIRDASAQQLGDVPHIGPNLAQNFHRALRAVDIAAEEELIARHGVRLVPLRTAAYPAPLTTIPDPPALLYLRGTLEARDANAVALVGSRQCTSYGRRVAERLAAGLVQKGFTVVSGLARGIDGAAHRGALQAGGRTLAVLAGGLAKIYPPEHADLAHEIEQHGALLSEAAMTMEPMAGMFPARNRLISGLCRGVVIVEAAERSGALITARHAAEQGRTVFAVPGPIDNAASAGALQLLRDGATLVRGVEDIIAELDGIDGAVTSAATPPPPGLDDKQQRIWDFLAEESRHVDAIARHLGVAVHEVTGSLMMLEMKKVVRRLPGNAYERL